MLPRQNQIPMYPWQNYYHLFEGVKASIWFTNMHMAHQLKVHIWLSHLWVKYITVMILENRTESPLTLKLSKSKEEGVPDSMI